MKYLFLFAHPDDESVASAGTIKQLIEHGDEVSIVMATDGNAGEVSEAARPKFEELGSLGKLRRQELQSVSEYLGVKNLEFLDFEDGTITNQMVWNELKTAFIHVIDTYRPDVVVTFDHSGWYFHLDHIGVSIAVTLAVQQAKFPPEVLLLSHFRVDSTKWKYIYTDPMPVTHVVDIRQYQHVKAAAYSLHQSQELNHSGHQADNSHREYYQLAIATEKGKQLLEDHYLFKPVKELLSD